MKFKYTPLTVVSLLAVSAFSLGNRGCGNSPEPMTTGPVCGPRNVLTTSHFSTTASLADDFMRAQEGVATAALTTPRNYIVTLAQGSSDEVMTSMGPRLKRFWPRLGIALIESSGSELMSLLSNDAVRGVERPHRLRAFGNLRPFGGDCFEPWVELTSEQQRRIGVDSVWGRTQGEGVRIAVLDTGINSRHSDLQGRVAAGRNFVPEGGASDVTGTVDPEAWDDDHGHGTHVAGIIAAIPNSLGMLGVAPDATLYAGKILDSEGYGDDLMLVDALDWSLSQNVHIVNMSLGSPVYSMALERAVQVTNSEGVILVGASGNDGDVDAGDANLPNYPASFPDVISVAALDDRNQRALFSTYNEYVDIAAPGTSVVSTYLNNRFACMDGTSQATPYVSGSFALLRAVFPATSHEELKRRLVCSARDLGAPGVDDETGYGQLRIDRAMSTTPTDTCGYPGEPIPVPSPTPTPITPHVPGDRNTMLVVNHISAYYLDTEEHPSGLVVRVRITNGNGIPVSGAQLRIDAWNPDSRQYIAGGAFETDGDGTAYARLHPVNCGTVHIEVPLVQKPGYEFQPEMGRTSYDYTFGM